MDIFNIINHLTVNQDIIIAGVTFVLIILRIPNTITTKVFLQIIFLFLRRIESWHKNKEGVSFHIDSIKDDLSILKGRIEGKAQG